MKHLIFFLGLVLLLSPGCRTGKTQLTDETWRNMTTFILVRHAEKAEDGTGDPGLTPNGKLRAQKLAAMLAPTGISAVYSTPYQRTRLTAEPTAEQEGLRVTDYDPGKLNLTESLVRRYRGETVLIVGHSNTVPMLVNALTGSTNFQQLEEMEYDKLFIVDVIGDSGSAKVFSY